ncbi:MAG: hypothetical protein LBU88_10220 [Treponema sp.]|jgi:hypothetical protein|nr:hypothetical protein [Treponema sp.]
MEIGNMPYQSFPTYGYAISAATTGRTSLPVSPSMVIYSQFKHVAGTPAPEGTQGVNITRLKILNTMIEQLEKMKGQDIANFGENGGREEIAAIKENDEKRINTLIEQYHREIKAAQNTTVYTPASPDTGMLFNIAA